MTHYRRQPTSAGPLVFEIAAAFVVGYAIAKFIGIML